MNDVEWHEMKGRCEFDWKEIALWFNEAHVTALFLNDTITSNEKLIGSLAMIYVILKKSYEKIISYDFFFKN